MFMRFRLRALARAMPPVCRAVRTDKGKPSPADRPPGEIEGPPPHMLLDSFVRALVDRTVRDVSAVIESSAEPEPKKRPSPPGKETTPEKENPGDDGS